jgi:hypothetical protein
MVVAPAVAADSEHAPPNENEFDHTDSIRVLLPPAPREYTAADMLKMQLADRLPELIRDDATGAKIPAEPTLAKLATAFMSCPLKAFGTAKGSTYQDPAPGAHDVVASSGSGSKSVTCGPPTEIVLPLVVKPIPLTPDSDDTGGDETWMDEFEKPIDTPPATLNEMALPASVVEVFCVVLPSAKNPSVLAPPPPEPPWKP